MITLKGKIGRSGKDKIFWKRVKKKLLLQKIVSWNGTINTNLKWQTFQNNGQCSSKWGTRLAVNCEKLCKTNCETGMCKDCPLKLNNEPSKRLVKSQTHLRLSPVSLYGGIHQWTHGQCFALPTEEKENHWSKGQYSYPGSLVRSGFDRGRYARGCGDFWLWPYSQGIGAKNFGKTDGRWSRSSCSYWRSGREKWRPSWISRSRDEGDKVCLELGGQTCIQRSWKFWAVWSTGTFHTQNLWEPSDGSCIHFRFDCCRIRSQCQNGLSSRFIVWYW